MRSPILNLAAGFLALVATPVVTLKAAVSRRRIMGHLAGFDEHLLRDIGLTRADVEAAMQGSLREDPTLRLSLLVRESRHNRSASMREQMEWARTVAEAEARPSARTDRRAA